MRKRRILLIIVLAAFIVSGGLAGYHIYDEYHTYHSRKATEYQPTRIVNGPYVLTTEIKELLGISYVSIQINDLEGNVLSRFPELYRVSGLRTIAWEEGTDQIIVESEEYGTVTYFKNDHGWVKSP